MADTMLHPSEQCATCAFRRSGGAADEVHNRLKGEICRLGGLPFLCHHAPDGRELNWRGSVADYFASMRSRRDRRVCAGWKLETAKLKARGWFDRFRFIRRCVAENACDSLAVFISRDASPEDKREAQRHLGRSIRFLARKNIGPLKIPLR